MDKEAKNQPQKDRCVGTGVARGQEVEIRVNGRTFRAFEGETIGAVLIACGIRQVRRSQHHQDPRGLYCCMGICHECLVTVDGEPNIKACVTPVKTWPADNTAGWVRTIQRRTPRANTGPVGPEKSGPNGRFQ